MNKDTSLADSAAPVLGGWLAPATFLIAITLAFMAPRSTPAVLGVLSIAILATRPRAPQLGGAGISVPLLIALSAFGGYLALNAAWSINPAEAYGKVLFYGVAIGSCSFATAAIQSLETQRAHALGRAVLVSFAIGAAFLAFEVLLDQPLRKLLVSLVPFARPDPKHARVADGWVTHIGRYALNRNFAVLSLAFWPSLLLLRHLLPPRRARVAGVALATVTAVAIFNSEHETSMLALVFAVTAFAGAWVAAPIMRNLILAGWVVAALLVVPVAMISYSAGLHRSELLPVTGRSRIILWGVTADKVWAAPWLGTGLASTKDLDDAAKTEAVQPKDHTYPLRTGRHAHNVYMQAWYELGALGAALLFGIGVLGLRALARCPVDVQPYAYASFVSAVLIGAFSWGLWQTWFMAAYGIWALLLVLAIKVAQGEGR